jgi:hypothetical protein
VDDAAEDVAAVLVGAHPVVAARLDDGCGAHPA